MAKFNTPASPPAAPVTRATSVIAAEPTPSTTTHEGAPGFKRTPHSELFLTLTGGFIAEDSFYEKADDRLARVRSLVDQIVLGYAGDVGFDWLVKFVTWLRGEGNIRTGSIVVAAEAVASLLAAKRTPTTFTARQIVDAACQRADEPGEFIAYWYHRFGRGTLPKPVKRGLADAVTRLYSPRSLLKWDSSKASVRFGDVVALVRPNPGVDKSGLYRYAIERRHPAWTDTASGELEAPALIQRRRELEAVPVDQRRAMARQHHANGNLANVLHAAGATWEWMSGWLADGKGMDAEAWTWALPQMGYMALIRNLRNVDEAGVPDTVVAPYIAKIADADEVARSRQLPYRFLSAYLTAPSDRWKHALGVALEHCLVNVPTLPGRSLILVDTSASMTDPMSAKSKANMVENAALFGIALGKRNAADIVGFASGEFAFSPVRGGNTLADVARFRQSVGLVGHGTDIHGAVSRVFKPGYHDRVFLFSDMQGSGAYRRSGLAHGVGQLVPRNVPVYGFVLNGEASGVLPSGGDSRFELGGLSDATFRQVANLEAGGTGRWPWEQ